MAAAYATDVSEVKTVSRLFSCTRIRSDSYNELLVNHAFQLHKY